MAAAQASANRAAVKSLASRCILGVTGGNTSIGPSCVPTFHIRNQSSSCPLKSCLMARINPKPHAEKKIKPISTHSPSDMSCRKFAFSIAPKRSREYARSKQAHQNSQHAELIAHRGVEHHALVVPLRPGRQKSKAHRISHRAEAKRS